MFSKILGLLNKIIYKVKYGKAVCFDGLPGFITHMQIYVKSGKVKFGKNFSIKQGVYIAAVNGGNITLGNNVSLNRNCILVSHESILIGDNCAIGPNTVFYDHDHNFGEKGIKSGYKTSPIVIENNCWIGSGVTVLRGAHIGEGSVIGAGCVVQGDIPPHSIVTSSRELNVAPISKVNCNED